MSEQAEITGFRQWLRGKARMITIYAACMSAVLGTAVAWGSLDLPRPAWHSELKAVELRVAANEELIYGDRWIRLTAQIKQLEAKLARKPGDADLIQELAVKQGQLRVVNNFLNGS